MTQIRVASINDAERILEIYAPYTAADCVISFETEPPALDEMRRRISDTLEQYPWLVYEQDERIVGYAYAGLHRSRAAYRWSVDVSVYVDGSTHRKGIGKALYTALFAILTKQGFINAYAGITQPNAKSEGLHKSFGFTEVGVFHHVGYKNNAWHDVVWLEMQLQQMASPPPEPCTFCMPGGTIP